MGLGDASWLVVLASCTAALALAVIVGSAFWLARERDGDDLFAEYAARWYYDEEMRWLHDEEFYDEEEAEAEVEEERKVAA